MINKVSIDQESVSMNAFELFTRQRGLQLPLQNLFGEVVMRHKANRSVRLNNTIVNELSEVKLMLDDKRKDITTKEAELVKKEKMF
jgi:hypothetical protein